MRRAIGEEGLSGLSAGGDDEKKARDSRRKRRKARIGGKDQDNAKAIDFGKRHSQSCITSKKTRIYWSDYGRLTRSG